MCKRSSFGGVLLQHTETREEDDTPPNDEDEELSLLEPPPVVVSAEEEEAEKLPKAYRATLLGSLMAKKRETSKVCSHSRAAVWPRDIFGE